VKTINLIKAFLTPIKTLEVQPRDLNEILKKLVEELDVSKTKITLEKAEGLPAVELNEERIEEMFTFFIGSAVEAASEQSDGFVQVRLEQLEAGARILITEKGQRDEDLTLEMLREPPFIHGKTYLYEQYLQLSLGLKYIEAHGGKCEIESDKKGGTTISIILPFLAKKDQKK
ncbi:MAG: ATP-binding protein, partial [Candidatus Margulisiibacteriota bacterium]